MTERESRYHDQVRSVLVNEYDVTKSSAVLYTERHEDRVNSGRRFGESVESVADWIARRELGQVIVRE